MTYNHGNKNNQNTTAGLCLHRLPRSGHMDFVDAVDRLFYVRVDRAQTIDDDLSNLYLTCLQAPMGCMEQLLVDLPELMEEHLG